MFLASLVQRLAPTIAAICAAIALHAGRHHAAIPLVVLAHGRLRRLLTRLDRLVLRVLAGRASRVRAPRVAATRPAATGVAAPGGLGWLIRLVPAAAQLRPQVEALVADAETLALVVAAPQAGRLLRPLCRMMGIVPPAGLLLPRRLRSAVARPAMLPAARLDVGGLLRVPAQLRLRVPGMPAGWHMRRLRCRPG